jgi:hypothetical protein
MPYSNPKQALAIFLEIQRRRGQAAAEAFGKKHSADMSRGAKAAAKASGRRPYRPKKARSK